MYQCENDDYHYTVNYLPYKYVQFVWKPNGVNRLYNTYNIVKLYLIILEISYHLLILIKSIRYLLVYIYY